MGRERQPGGSVQLYLLRHAHAGDRESWSGDDDERPLTAKGRRQSERLGRFFRDIGFRPDAIVTSPKSRASQTAEIVGKRLGLSVTLDERLGSDLGLGRLEEVVGDLGADRPVLVGHDPDLSSLVAILCGASRVPMKKGALARIDVDRPFQPGGGVLRWLVPPDLLKAGD